MAVVGILGHFRCVICYKFQFLAFDLLAQMFNIYKYIYRHTHNIYVCIYIFHNRYSNFIIKLMEYTKNGEIRHLLLSTQKGL